MEQILEINYQGRAIRIMADAFALFEAYENRLKQYFEQQVSGEETFADIQYRMGEILENLNKNKTIEVQDVKQLIAMIGEPSEFGEEATIEDESNSSEDVKEENDSKKGFYRNTKDKMIAGVCSGIANYFAIDPLAVRLLFVLVTVFNIATLFKFNLGILIYLILWIVLSPRELTPNITSKLFRNPKDLVIGGVCSGLAQFFNIETWIVRILFASPLLISVLSNNSYLNRFNIDIMGHSMSSIVVITYILLWIITPLAKTNTDYMLLKKKPININTHKMNEAINEVAMKSASGLSKFLKVVAYILIGTIVITMVPFAISMILGSAFAYHIISLILFSSLNKFLAILTLCFVFVLPIVGIILWLTRKIIGYRSPNRMLRLIFIGLHVIGWLCGSILFANVIRQHNTYVSEKTEYTFVPMSETIMVHSDRSSVTKTNVWFDLDFMNDFVLSEKDTNRYKSVFVQFKRSNDSLIHVLVDRSASGKNQRDAELHNKFNLIPSYDGSSMNIPLYISLPNNTAYNFQFATITVFIPSFMETKVSNEFKNQQYLRINNRGFTVNTHTWSTAKDMFEDEDERVLRIKDNKEKKEELIQELRELQTELDDNILELENKLRETKQNTSEQQRELENEIREAKEERERKINEMKNKLHEQW